MTTGLPSRIENHAERSSEELPPALYKPRVVAFAAAFGEQVQIAEDGFNSLIEDRLLAVASGAALDQYGALVGEARGGLDDESYRAFIGARILANASKGEAWRLIRIVAILSGADYVRLFEAPPAGIRIEFARLFRLPASRLRRLLSRLAAAIPAGVQLRSVVEAKRAPFGFKGNPAALGFNRGVFAGLR